MNKQEYKTEIARIGESLKSDLHGEDLAVVDVEGISEDTADSLLCGVYKTGKAIEKFLRGQGVEDVRSRIASDIRGAIRRA